jgi:predicted transcriptional regulator
MVLEKRRDKLEIIKSILSICRSGEATKTRVVYKANLNFKTAGIYLEWLIKRELVSKDENHFKLTTKGSKLLSNLQDITPLFNEIDAQAGSSSWNHGPNGTAVKSTIRIEL